MTEQGIMECASQRCDWPTARLEGGVTSLSVRGGCREESWKMLSGNGEYGFVSQAGLALVSASVESRSLWAIF